MNNRPIEKIKVHIAKLRKKAGLTQAQLAKKLGVTENTIANWEKGRSGTEWVVRVIKMCEILKCNANELIEIEVVETKNFDKESIEEMIGELQKLLIHFEPNSEKSSLSIDKKCRKTSSKVEAS